MVVSEPGYSGFRRAAVCDDGAARMSGGVSSGPVATDHATHAAPLFRDTPVGSGCGHTHDSVAVGASPYRHDSDLHPCDDSGLDENRQPPGFTTNNHTNNHTDSHTDSHTNNITGTGTGTGASSKLTFGKILRDHGKSHVESESQCHQVRNTLRRLAACRTRLLGGRVISCLHCGDEQHFYNSCGDRHCPACGGAKRARWLEARRAEQLPTGYFAALATPTPPISVVGATPLSPLPLSMPVLTERALLPLSCPKCGGVDFATQWQGVRPVGRRWQEVQPWNTS